MITGAAFAGDDNHVLMGIQHDTYGPNLWLLFNVCRSRYLSSARLVGTDTVLTLALTDLDSFDHRTLQDSHDLIAAWYRFTEDAGQMSLPFDGADYLVDARRRWRDWFDAEVHGLVKYDKFALNVCLAAGFPNPDSRGIRAEEELAEFLGKHYDNEDGMPWTTVSRLAFLSD